METKTVYVGFKITPAQKGKLDQLAAMTGKTMSGLVREWIELFWQMQTDDKPEL